MLLTQRGCPLLAGSSHRCCAEVCPSLSRCPGASGAPHGEKRTTMCPRSPSATQQLYIWKVCSKPQQRAHKYKFDEGISNKCNQYINFFFQQVIYATEDKHLLGHGGSLQILTVSGLFSLQRPIALSLVRHRTGRSCVPLPQLTEH